MLEKIRGAFEMEFGLNVEDGVSLIYTRRILVQAYTLLITIAIAWKKSQSWLGR